MVKRYDSDMDAPHGMERNDKQGYWVEFSDYLALQAALRAALAGWEDVYLRYGITPVTPYIAVLRAQFLDDK